MLIVAIGLWTIAIIILIVKPHNKTFKVASGLAFVCGFSGIVDFLAVNAIAWSEKYNIPLEKLYLLQSILVTIPHFFGPLVILVYGMSCYNDLKKTHTKKIIYILLLIPVILSYIFLPYKTPQQLTQNELSNFFLFLSLWAVPYMVCGNLLVFLRVIKEKSSSERKYWFLNAVMSIPFITYAIFANFILRIFHIENTFNLFKYFIPIQVILFLYFGVKYGVLGVKIKLERHKHAIAKVFNYISDAVVITDPNLDIVEINKSFYDHFGNCKDLISLELLLDNTELKSYKEEILNIVKAKKTGLVSVNCNSKFFDLEITPIIKDYSFEGVFLIAKDVTQHKNNLILLKERQEELIEKEKYSTFSHLIGGIAHNLKTPLMASLGGIEILKKTTNFFKNIDLDNVPEKFTTSIAKKEKWEKAIQENLEYVSETITLIQNHSVGKDSLIKVSELLKKIDIFMKFELNHGMCKLIKNVNVSMDYEIKNIYTILEILILNAIQSYENNTVVNTIELNISEAPDQLLFEVKDYGKGISDELKKDIFKKMITTKGDKGSGLGLYISQILVKAKFNGEIWFESNLKGTSFFISLPNQK